MQVFATTCRHAYNHLHPLTTTCMCLQHCTPSYNHMQKDIAVSLIARDATSYISWHLDASILSDAIILMEDRIMISSDS